MTLLTPPLDPKPVAKKRREATVDEMVAKLRAHPGETAILSDIDGTLAAIVKDDHAVAITGPVRSSLRRIRADYRVVGFNTGRRVPNARKIVGLDNVYYIGNFGFEWQRPGSNKVELDPAFRQWRRPVRSFSRRAFKQLKPLGVARGDKDAIIVFSWSSAPDPAAAEQACRRVAVEARAAGLGVQEASGAIEIRPPVHVDKGTAIEKLLAEHPEIKYVYYAGDDYSDIRALEVLGRLVTEGRLKMAVRVGVSSWYTPPALLAAANVVVQGTDGVAALLQRIAGPSVLN